jgi:hypothetical protein
MRQRYEINTSRRAVVTSPESRSNGKRDAVSAQTSPSPSAVKGANRKGSQRSGMVAETHTSASNNRTPSRTKTSIPIPSRLRRTPKPLETPKKRPAPIREDRKTMITKIPHPPRQSKAAAPREKGRVTSRRQSIATSDMINSLRVQCAALTVTTPPATETTHTIADSSSSPVVADSLHNHATDSSTDVEPVPTPLTRNDFGTRLSILYPATTTASFQVKAKEVTSRKLPIVHLRPLRNVALAATRVSSISTSSSDESENSIRRPMFHRCRNNSQILRPWKPYSTSRSNSNRSMSLPRKGPLIFATVKKQVRFAPLPTTIRRYPPDSSDSEDEEGSRDYLSELQSPIDGPTIQSPWLRQVPPRASSLRAPSAIRSRYPEMPSTQAISPSLKKPAPQAPPVVIRPAARTKNSFARRSLSRIMKIDRPISFGLPTIQSAWSLDENKSRREREDDASSTKTTKSRIPLPKLRLGNLFSRFT